MKTPRILPSTVSSKGVLSRSIASFFVLCTPGMALDNLWTGAINKDWNTAGNWNLGRVPNNVNGQPAPNDFDDAVVNVLNNFPLITGNFSATPRDIVVASGAGSNGRVDQNAGMVSTGVNNWLFIARDGGTGVYNLADTSVPAGTGGTLTGFGLSSGSVSVGGGATAGRVYVGGAHYGAGGTGTLNVNTSGTLQIGNDLAVGSAGGTGVMNVDAGTITTGGWNFIGKDESSQGANGTLNMSGGTLTNSGRTYVGMAGSTGKMELSGGSYYNPSDLFTIGENAGSKGTVTVSNSASFLQLGETWVGQHSGSGTLTTSAGTVTISNWFAVGRDGGTGTFNLSGGTITKSGGAATHVILGSLGGVGTANQTGGTITTVGNGDLLLGENAGGKGTWNISAGTASFDSVRVGWIGGGIGALNVSGTGQVNAALLNVAENGNGTVAQTGGSVSISGNVDVQGAGVGAYNLSGGTLAVDGTLDTLNGTFNFSGGKLTRSTAGVLSVNGNLLIANQAANLKLDTDKTFSISGAFDITTGVTFDLTGRAIPLGTSSTPNTGSFTLGTVGNISGPFGVPSTRILGLNANGATFISETAGESGTYNSSTQSVYWIQENGGVVDLRYSVVPEPGTLGLLVTGLFGLAVRRRCKK